MGDNLFNRSVSSLEQYLSKAGEVILPPGSTRAFDVPPEMDGQMRVGVDLGTAYLVLVVLDHQNQPVAGQYRFAQVVRDGLVVDFIGAVDLLKEMKTQVEAQTGLELTHAASGFPPGVPRAEVRAVANVVEAVGLRCTGLIDEPSAANNLLRLRDGAILDVGGGTTGIAILKDGEVIYTADEATGGTHFSLVIAGALGISFEEAEELKKDPAQQSRLFPHILPVMEKVGCIAARHLEKFPVTQLALVGGACAYPGMAKVIQEYTGVPTFVPEPPLFVTPIGIAMHDQVETV